MCIAALIVAGCSTKPQIRVTNRSPYQLTDLVISGTGFSHRIDALSSGANVSFPYQMTAGSRLQVSFSADKKHVEAAELSYVYKASSSVAVSIGPDLAVSVRSELPL